MVDAVPGALPRDLVVFPQEGRQLELLQVVGEQDLGHFRRRLGRRAILPPHAAAPPESSAA